jgi:hypothetical protein
VTAEDCVKRRDGGPYDRHDFYTFGSSRFVPRAALFLVTFLLLQKRPPSFRSILSVAATTTATTLTLAPIITLQADNATAVNDASRNATNILDVLPPPPPPPPASLPPLFLPLPCLSYLIPYSFTVPYSSHLTSVSVLHFRSLPYTCYMPLLRQLRLDIRRHRGTLHHHARQLPILVRGGGGGGERFTQRSKSSLPILVNNIYNQKRNW